MQNEDPLDADPTLANRFLAHQLSESERALIEAELRSNPDLIEELEAAARFKIGLQRLRDAGELDGLLAPRGSSWLRSLRGSAFAVAAVALVVVGAVLVRLSTVPMALAASAAELAPGKTADLPVSRTYLVIRRRALAERVSIDLPATRQAIKLRIQPRPEVRAPYRVAITPVPGRGAATVAGVAVIETADRDGLVSVFADSARLRSGSYLLVISAASSPGAAPDSYLLEVLAE